MKLRNKWQQNVSPSSSASSSTTSYVTSPSSQTSEGNDNDKYNEAWNEVDKEIGNLQKLFSENDNIGYENSYLNNEEFQYQPQNYAPISKTLTTEDEYYDDSDEEEESEMQFMQSSEPSEFERNVQFRHDFEKYFKGRYDEDGPTDQWLKMMTDESIVDGKGTGNYQQPSEFERNVQFRHDFERIFKGRYDEDGPIDLWLKLMTDESIVDDKRAGNYQQQQQHHYHFNDDDIIQEEDETDDTLVEEDKSFAFKICAYDEIVVDEDEENALQILEKCESVLKQLEILTAVPSKKHQKRGLQRNLETINKYEIDCESTTPRAASSTFGYEESFDIIRN
uniref:Uncharacterized protein n=1 Tax=Panagrolaimus davidi TaxID=227884 RepID=A0A914QQ86_9BILA